MRMTFNSQYRDAAAGIEAATTRLVEFQRQVASGKRMGRVSDDPEAAATAIAERSDLAAVGQYTRATDSVASRLTVTDTVLSDIVQKLTAAQVAALSARGTTKTPVERDAAALQLGGLRTALLDDVNTSFHGTYVFSGSKSTTRPFVEDALGAIAYQGNSSEVKVDIGDGRSVAVEFDGDAIVAGSDPADLFATLDSLIAAVTAGDDDAIGVGMAGLDRAFSRATAAQTRLGNDLQVLDTQKLRLQQMRLSGAERLSKLEDANMAEAISGMTQADAAHRAALGAAATAARVSLMDYLK